MAINLNIADELAARLVAMLTASGEMLAVVESCTGGEVGAALTRVPGASKCFWGSVTAYTVGAKYQVIGVSEDVLSAHGTVSSVTTSELAVRVRDLSGATYGAAVTGWAGPSADGPDPVGTVYLAISGANRVRVLRCVYDGDRIAVRQSATSELLRCVIEEVVRDHDPACVQE